MLRPRIFSFLFKSPEKRNLFMSIATFMGGLLLIVYSVYKGLQEGNWTHRNSNGTVGYLYMCILGGLVIVYSIWIYKQRDATED